MPDSSISVVPIGDKTCKPFLLEVMVFSPEAGYKFKVVVERSCTPEADAIWKIVFDLFKVEDAKEIQLVHVSYKAGTPVEKKAVQAMAVNGVTPGQAKVLAEKVHPAVKAVAGKPKATKAEKQKINGALAEVLTISNE